MGISMLIEPPVAAVHALIAGFSPMVGLMSQSLLILPPVDLVIVSIRILPIESALRVSLEVLPHLRVPVSLRACLVIRSVDVASIGGDWFLGLGSCDVDSGMVGGIVVAVDAGSDSERGLCDLLAADEGSDEAEAECFLDVHSIIKYF